MQRAIVKDQFRLMQKSRAAGKADLSVGQDLLDTLAANRERCVGLAANMIGQNVSVIAFMNGPVPMEMFNPVIVEQSGPYETEEGCLSLVGVRKTTRYQRIVVEWQDRGMVKRRGAFEGYVAQIIQHEVDHCKGIVI